MDCLIDVFYSAGAVGWMHTDHYPAPVLSNLQSADPSAVDPLGWHCSSHAEDAGSFLLAQEQHQVAFLETGVLCNLAGQDSSSRADQG